MSAASDNAQSAAGMRAALTGIGDFIYRQQVQRPLLEAQTQGTQAQTAETQARTAGMNLLNPLQGQALTTQNKMAGMQADQMATQNFLQNQLGTPPPIPLDPTDNAGDLDPNAPVTAPKPAPATDAAAAATTPPAKPAPAPATKAAKPAPATKAAKQTDQEPTDAFTAPDPGLETPEDAQGPSEPEPVSAGPAMSKPLYPGDQGIPLALGQQPQPRSRFQGITPSASVLRPSATAVSDYNSGTSASPTVRPLPEITDLGSTARGTPLNTKADNDAAANPTSEAPSGTSTGSAVQVNPPPQVTLPAPQAAPKTYDPINYLTKPWTQHPPEVQKALLDFAHSEADKAGVHVTDAQIIQQMAHNRAAVMSNILPQDVDNLIVTGTDEHGNLRWGIGAPGMGGRSPMSFDQWAPLQKDVLERADKSPSKSFAQQAQTSMEQAEAAAAAANRPGETNQGQYDTNLMSAYERTLDPAMRSGSTSIQETLLKTNLPQTIKHELTKWKTGARLTPDARTALVDSARSNFIAAAHTANQDALSFKQSAEASYPGTRFNVLIPYNLEPPGGGQSASGPSAVPSGGATGGATGGGRSASGPSAVPPNAVRFQSAAQINALPSGQNIPVLMPNGKVFYKH